ncbi:hypothetical protein ROSINTL182_09154 [Roseburia intestinalis L1-82]|uniref:Uncharacterized protein n=1 Tax=Roseburia intestinalis L1-82 TaxID=536231 RepID=C7GGT3_9FIRM|nr:hypothetical protein ROSINTL182_09154 [Roseburia intestinalis L1-82]
MSVSVCTISAACVSSGSVSPSDPVFSVRVSSDSSVSSLSVTSLLSVPVSSSFMTAVSSCAANTLSGFHINLIYFNAFSFNKAFFGVPTLL